MSERRAPSRMTTAITCAVVGLVTIALVMFGSDWPQSESLGFNSYPNVFGVELAYVSGRGPSAMEKVFWKNSLKPYRWVQRLPSQRQA